MILVLCPFGLDRGLVSRAFELSGGAVRALVPAGAAADAAESGAKIIHTVPDTLQAADEAAFADWLADRVRAWGDRIVLAPATVRMRAVMPALAWRLGAGLTADCTDLARAGDRLIQIRPAFGNSLLAEIETVSAVQMATVRPGIFPPAAHPAQAEIVAEQPPGESSRVRLLEMLPLRESIPLRQAKIIVAGGLGVGSREGFEKLGAFAKKLGAALGASRGAVDAGYAPYRCQIGLTGVTVCPRLYIAVGISGAVQHLAGMSGAEKVVAVNPDPKAPIFDYADYGVVAPWEEVLKSWTEEQS